MITQPVDPLRRVRPGTPIRILGVVRSVQRKITAPLVPTHRINETVKERLHVNRPRIFLPRPAKVGLGGAVAGGEVVGGSNGAVLDGGAGVLAWVGPALGGDGVELALVREPGVEVAVLEDDGGVAEDKVNGAVDVAFTIELPFGMSVEGVLVGLETAPVEGREVGTAPQRYRLVFAWPRGVAHR